MSKKWNNLLLIALVLGGLTSLHAGVVIDQIHYIPGEDFVQLHFQTSKVIIPDYFYPDKANLKHLVVRIKDAEVKADPASLRFDSPVIEAVELKKADAFTDVDITLKEEVNFRLFTNQGGLYIEFPVIRNLGTEVPPATAVATATPAPAASTGTGSASATETRSLVTMAEGTPIKGRVQLKGVRLVSQGADRLSFEFEFSDKVTYRVIPIADAGAARLAIDVKNVQAKRLNQTIQQGTVRSLRGAYNTPTDYRIVFDLTALKHYTVQDRGALLTVAFGESALLATADQPGPAAPVAAESTLPPPVVPATVPAAASPAPTPAAAPREFFPAEKSKTEDAPLISGTVEQTDAQGQEVEKPLSEDYIDPSKQFKGEPMTFTFKNTDLIDVLKAIGQISGLNIIVDPNVAGKVTCELVKVPWDQALDLFLRVNGLEMIQEGNILRIGQVTNLQREADERRALREAKESEGKLQLFPRTLSFAKCTEVIPILKAQLSKRGEVISDVRTNTLIITEIPERMAAVDKLLTTLDAPIPQVSIEARIVEASSNALDTFGIQWGYNVTADAAHGNQTSMKFPATVSSSGTVTKPNPQGYAINLPVADTAISPTLKLGNIANTFNLDVALSAMTSKGKGRIISSPKMTTQNNKEATIMQGQKIPIQTNQNNTITTQYVNAALELKVTPQITAQGSIIMDLDLKNDIADFTEATKVGGIPIINTESAKTTVLINDGGTIVIGGMYKLVTSSNSTGVPILSKIPFLGSLFRNSSKKMQQQELLIFLTPRIIK